MSSQLLKAPRCSWSRECSSYRKSPIDLKSKGGFRQRLLAIIIFIAFISRCSNDFTLHCKDKAAWVDLVDPRLKCV